MSVKEKLKQDNIFPKKNFSQNFIFDNNLLDKFVNSISEINLKHVIEIGPGPGTLTSRICIQNPKSFNVIEIDERFSEILKSIKFNLKIHFCDALKFDFQNLISEIKQSDQNAKIVVFSNLPYNVSSQIMFKLFNLEIDEMVLLFQKEMADRIRAKKSTKDYGKISVLAEYLFSIQKIMDISPNCFYPAPNVTSTLLKFTRKRNNDIINLENFSKLLQISFGTRRKQLKNNLKQLVKDSESLFDKLKINYDVRAEDLGLDDFLNLYEELKGVL